MYIIDVMHNSCMTWESVENYETADKISACNVNYNDKDVSNNVAD